MSDIQTAQAVIETEIAGLQALAQGIDAAFEKAVTAIHAMKEAKGNGRVIVAGIGKSGHVARKIAATLASTGTPAYFVHPGEASHGDLGMITRSDIVLMLSNSGENSELTDLIHFTRRFGITLIAVTGKPGSTLGQHADIILPLPAVPEACPNGLAPTTSTTMMMALGDAIAVTLLNRMGLTAEQFKVFHPGGKLGRKLLRVSDVMIGRTDMAVIAPDATMDKAILALSEKNLGVVVVLDGDGVLKGIITDGDLKRHMDDGLLKKPVHTVMSAKPRTIDSTALAAEAMDLMTRDPSRYVTALIAVDTSGAVNGLIRLQDCLNAGIA